MLSDLYDLSEGSELAAWGAEAGCVPDGSVGDWVPGLPDGSLSDPRWTQNTCVGGEWKVLSNTPLGQHMASLTWFGVAGTRELEVVVQGQILGSPCSRVPEDRFGSCMESYHQAIGNARRAANNWSYTGDFPSIVIWTDAEGVSVGTESDLFAPLGPIDGADAGHLAYVFPGVGTECPDLGPTSGIRVGDGEVVVVASQPVHLCRPMVRALHRSVWKDGVRHSDSCFVYEIDPHDCS